jgi:hypothetical protein
MRLLQGLAEGYAKQELAHKRKKWLADYLDALCWTRDMARTEPFEDDLVYLLNKKILNNKQKYGALKKVVKSGAQKDRLAGICAQVAHHLLVHDDTSWRQKARLTDGSAWLMLSSLLYEAVTGKSRDMWAFCRKCDKQPVNDWREFVDSMHLGASITDPMADMKLRLLDE